LVGGEAMPAVGGVSLKEIHKCMASNGG